MEGVESHPTSGANVPATPRKQKCSPTRGHPSRMLYRRSTHFTITGYDRATKALATLGRERYQRQSPLHPIGGYRLGGCTDSTDTSTATTGNSTRFNSRNLTPATAHTTSLASRLRSIGFYHATMHVGSIPPARRWTRYTFRTPYSSAKTTGTTPLGPSYPTSYSNYVKVEQHLR
jgi:hypothetical protein